MVQSGAYKGKRQVTWRLSVERSHKRFTMATAIHEEATHAASEAVTVVRERYRNAGQEHVLACIDAVAEEKRSALLKQLASIQVENLPRLLAAANQEQSADGDNIEPFRGPIGSFTDEDLRAKSQAIGMEAINNQQVAALVRRLARTHFRKAIFF